ncbi:hypothetical protein [Bacillus toyonensis]|uniref:hypothetical protein n=1 Tax=Bacillus toyonensis TaxID=155322 RepID=UPI000BF230D3|nr:hypothetical protein [Bacillus toyonensis]PEL24340.1 hypothetical protein CN624_18310 [Bacillus toyonensis]
MTNEKVLLPKDVVEGINHLRNNLGKSNSYILNESANWSVNNFANTSVANKDLLMKALVIGFEAKPEPVLVKHAVTETNAKKVKEEFERMGKPRTFSYEDGIRDGYRMLLGTLGVQIKGINA